MDGRIDNPARRGGAISLLCIAAVFTAAAVLRILAPSDLHEGDQPKQADYVLDIVCNGNWLVQHAADGAIMSKPPLYNWLAAPMVLLFGAEDVFLKMPSLLAGLGTALMAWDMVRRRLGERAALWGAVALILTAMFAREMYYARTDMLLTCFIVMQFWAVLRWEDSASEKSGFHSGWIQLFWAGAALGNLTKGPLAFLPHLALATWWLAEKRFYERYRRMGLWWGVPLALLPCAIWFGLAYRAEGYPLYEHMFKVEIVDRFRSVADKLADKGADKSNRNFFYYIPHVLFRTLPWSLFALAGFWGVYKMKENTALSDRERSLLRLVAAWFLTTLLFFSLIPSKRADRIFPAVPALCLIAGWAFAGFLESFKTADGQTRIELRLSRWIALALAILFSISGLGLVGLASAPQFAPFNMIARKFEADTLELLAFHRALVLAVGVTLACAGLLGVVATFKKRARSFSVALIVCELALMSVYEQVFGSWLDTDLCQGSAAVCREVRKRARAERAPVIILRGSGPAARFYLLQAGLETLPEDAAKRLALSHPALYVIGAQPSIIEVDPRHPKSTPRKTWGLEQAGLSAAQPVPVSGVPNVRLDGPLPAKKWLGAVWVPARE